MKLSWILCVLFQINYFCFIESEHEIWIEDDSITFNGSDVIEFDSGRN